MAGTQYAARVAVVKKSGSATGAAHAPYDNAQSVVAAAATHLG